MRHDVTELSLWVLAVQTRYFRAACLALLLWEYVLTFHDEVRLIWRQSWSVATILFIIIRYIGIGVLSFGVYVNGHVPGTTCSWWLRIEAAGNLIIMWSVMAILQLRLYGLYNKSRRIGIFLVTGYIVQAALSILVYGTAVRSIVVAQFIWPGAYQDCWPEQAPAILPLYFVPPIVYESMLCVLAGRKCWERVRETRTNPLASRALYDVLIRDSIAYYVVILATYAINMWSWIAYLPASLDHLTPFAIAIPSLLGGRLLLNVRIAYYDAPGRGAGAPPRRPDDLSLHIATEPPGPSDDAAPAPTRDGWLGLACDANPVGTGLFRPDTRASVRSASTASIRTVRRSISGARARHEFELRHLELDPVSSHGLGSVGYIDGCCSTEHAYTWDTRNSARDPERGRQPAVTVERAW